MKTFDFLAKLDFGKIIAESIASNKTQTGRELLEKYSAICMKSPVSCGLVNAFLKEAQNYMYDEAVYEAVVKINKPLNENKVSWALATACESINANTSKYNYINRIAAEHVMDLLEGRNEEEVVNYIKAGALKSDMFCESIRNIVKSVYRDQTVIVETSNYTCVHPVSYVEIVEGKTYFALGKRVFSMDEENNVNECFNGEAQVSAKFGFINEMLNNTTYDGNGTFSYTLKANTPIQFQISESGSIVRTVNEKEETMTVESFRENNRLFLMTINPARRNEVARVLEGLACLAENFDSVVLVEEVSFFTTSRGKQFMIIEGANGINFTVPGRNGFTKNYTSIVEALNDIKSIVKLDLTNLYEERINAEFEAKSAAEQAEVTESLEQASIQERREKIAMLTEAYKNDPATLAVLSRVALELNEL